MTVSRRGVLAGAAAAVLPLHGAGAATGLTMLTDAAPDTLADAAAGLFLASLRRAMPDAAVEARRMPGRSGLTMLAALAEAGQAGTTFGWVVTPTLPARMVDRGEPSLLQRITLLGQVQYEPIAFVSPADHPASSVQDLIQRSADDADAVPLGTPPAGSAPFLAALRLQSLAQTRLNIIPFPSATAALQAVLAGNVSAAALGLSRAIEGIRDGNLAAIGIAARRRFGLLPDTPVLDEAGIPLSAFIRRGIGVPAGTPALLMTELTNAARAAAADTGFSEAALAAGYYARWQDGPTWLAKTETETAALAALWATDPWPVSPTE